MRTSYLPRTWAIRPHEVQSPVLSDLVVQIEPWRQYAASEMRRGRLPLWNPYGYCGAPFLAAGTPALLSPVRLLDVLFPGPRVLAWTQLLFGVLGGVGAYVFFRRGLGVRREASL